MKLYVTLCHDFIRGTSAVEYLAESESGQPLLIRETVPLAPSLGVASGIELFRFWSKFPTQKAGVPYLRVLSMTSPGLVD
jgi:hypothetical protein